jgi:hypothetical protein
MIQTRVNNKKNKKSQKKEKKQPPQKNEPPPSLLQRAQNVLQKLKSCPKLQNFSAYTIQCFWRRCKKITTHTLVAKFIDFELNETAIKSANIHDISAKLQKDDIVALTRKIIIRFYYASLALPRIKEYRANYFNIKNLLASYLIHYRKEEVLVDETEEETTLIVHAKQFVECFNKMLHVYFKEKSFKNLIHELQTFEDIMFVFVQNFRKWKEVSEEKRVCRAKIAMIMLYKIKAALPSQQGWVEEDFKIEDRIKKLEDNIIQNSSGEVFNALRIDVLGHYICESQKFPDKDERFAMINDNLKLIPSNDELSHEVCINRAFTLSEDGSAICINPLISIVRGMYKDSVYESMCFDLQLVPPNCKRVLEVFEELRTCLLNVGGDNVKIINEIIDIDMFKQQLEQDALTLPDIMKVILNVQRLIDKTMPPRQYLVQKQIPLERFDVLNNEKTKIFEALKKFSPSSFCNAIRFLSDQAEYLRIFYTNVRVGMMYNIVSDQMAHVERTKFERRVTANDRTWDNTKVHFIILCI